MTTTRPKNISIIGCGPAGLSTAIALHDSGFNVTIYEQFSQPGPVGSGLMLQPTGLEVLDSFGLRASAEELGQKIDGMLGRIAPNGKIVLDIKYNVLNKNMYGVAIHRASLFHILYSAVVDRKINILTNQKICGLCRHADHKVTLQDNNGLLTGEPADLIVDASGVQSKLLKYANTSRKVEPPGEDQPLGRQLEFGALWTTVELTNNQFDQHLLEQRYKKANIMIGVLPCGTLPESDTQLATLFWSIKARNFNSWKNNGLEHWKNEVSGYWPEVTPLLDQIHRPDQLTHATYSHHTLKQPWGQSLVFVGDAAHATSPQLGQGANMALLDALALATALQNCTSTEEASHTYARLRRQHVRWYQAISYLLTPFYQSDSHVLPLLRDTLFEPVSAIGFMNKLMTKLGSGVLTQPVAKIHNHNKAR